MEEQDRRQGAPLNLSKDTPDALSAYPGRLQASPVVEAPVWEELSMPVEAAETPAAKAPEPMGKGAVVKAAAPAARNREMPLPDTAKQYVADVPEAELETPVMQAAPEEPVTPPPEMPEVPVMQTPETQPQETPEMPETQPQETPKMPQEMQEAPGTQTPQAPRRAPDIQTPVPLQTAKRPAAPEPLSNEAVTGHTAAMWKYRPIPEDEPEPAPEYRKTHQKFSGGEVIAARVRGKKHKHEGTNCDDWYEASACGDLVFAAVSDGAGSKRFSRIGARESSRAAVGYLRQAFGELLKRRPEVLQDVARAFSDPRCMPACGEFAGAVQQAVLKAREAVETAWYTRLADPAYEAVLGRPPVLTDFSATLLVAAVIPAGSAGHLVVSCQVGDGMTVLVNSRGEFESAVKLMGEADSGEFSGETDFLTSPKMASLETLQNRTKLSIGHSDTLLMMTDGVADDYFPPQREMRRLYFDLLSNGVLIGQSGELRPEVVQYYRAMPEPVSYPWVNDQSVQVPLHYTRRILEAGGTMEELWTNRLALAMAGMESQEAEPAENLRLWLDNYVERGSFDDRTLLVIRM